MDRIETVKNILELTARQLSRSYNLEHRKKIFDQLETSSLIEDLNKSINTNDVFHRRKFNNVFELNVYRNFLYYLIKLIKPKNIIETGVFHGLTSLWILQALEENSYGTLTSIDLPRRDWDKFFPGRPMGGGHQGEDELPSDCNPGWIVPAKLRDRWRLMIGPSEKLLDEALEGLEVDLFIHDSDHSYETMKFEVETVLKKNNECFLVIDNFDHSNFIYEFLSKNIVTPIFINDIDEFNDIAARFALIKMGNFESSHERWNAQIEAREKNSQK